MILKAAAALGAAILLAGAAQAGEPAGGSSRNPNKIVCRTTQQVGSRLAKDRACHTLAEWEDLRRQSKKVVDDIQNSRVARISDDPPGM